MIHIISFKFKESCRNVTTENNSLMVKYNKASPLPRVNANVMTFLEENWKGKAI